MKQSLIISMLLIAFNIILMSACNADERKGLILTKEGITQIQANLGKTPLFDKTLQQMKLEVDAEIEKGIDTPVPRDFSGGYTHQRHKANFFLLQKAGVLFQILEDEKYANYVRDMFFQYEAMYKGLPLHPQTRSYARGKLFWQSLNDSNWLVYAAQAYDALPLTGGHTDRSDTTAVYAARGKACNNPLRSGIRPKRHAQSVSGYLRGS